MQTKLASFLLGEGRAFVQPLAVEEIHPARKSGNLDPFIDCEPFSFRPFFSLTPTVAENLTG